MAIFSLWRFLGCGYFWAVAILIFGYIRCDPEFFVFFFFWHLTFGDDPLHSFIFYFRMFFDMFKHSILFPLMFTTTTAQIDNLTRSFTKKNDYWQRKWMKKAKRDEDKLPNDSFFSYWQIYVACFLILVLTVCSHHSH